MGTLAIILASLRGLHLLGLASLFGTLVSLALVAPAGLQEAERDGFAAEAAGRASAWSASRDGPLPRRC